MSFQTFLIFALLVLLGADYFFSASAAHFFRITGTANRLALLAVIVFLSLSFIIASLLAHRQENTITRAYYFFSGFWLGLFLNLVMATVIVWLIIGISAFTSVKPSQSVLACIFFGLAFVYSAYGTWNAFNPQVKNITVRIKNLPKAWRGKRIVQLSDVHLGFVYRADFLRKIVNETNALHPEMVVITGDLFDGMDGKLTELVSPVNELQAPDGIYFITGNHETYLGVGKAFAALRQTKVTILNDQMEDIDGIRLIGISYPERGEKKDIAKTIRSLPGFVPGKPTILLYHSPAFVGDAPDLGINLQLSGHTHKGQLFPFEFITHRIYKGFDYGLQTLGDFSIYTTDGVGTWGPPMRTGNRPEIVCITLEKERAVPADT